LLRQQADVSAGARIFAHVRRQDDSVGTKRARAIGIAERTPKARAM